MQEDVYHNKYQYECFEQSLDYFMDRSKKEVVGIRATSDGQVLRLKDIAEVELGRLTYGYTNNVNGHPSVTCIIFQTAGSNATQIIKDIEALLQKSEETFPPGVKVNISQNANDFLFASIHEVIKTLLEAFVLVFIVVYVFLQDFRSTLIPAIAIPVALIGTFFVLYLIGFSITSVMDTIAPPNSFMASIEANREDLYPWSSFAWTPSTTTMASSTTMAMASTIAQSVSRLMLNPIK